MKQIYTWGNITCVHYTNLYLNQITRIDPKHSSDLSTMRWIGVDHFYSRLSYVFYLYWSPVVRGKHYLKSELILFDSIQCQWVFEFSKFIQWTWSGVVNYLDFEHQNCIPYGASVDWTESRDMICKIWAAFNSVVSKSSLK